MTQYRARTRGFSPQRRLRLLSAFAMFIFVVFLGRLFWMQVVTGADTAAKVLDQNTVTREITAPRGEIQDASGLPLAVTIDARNITADQTLILNPESTAQVLAPVIGADPVALAQHLTGTRRFVYIAKEVTPAVWKQISDLNLAGIYSEPATRRVYPQGQLAANVIGYLNAENEGRGGIEYAYQDELAGTPGKTVYVQAGGSRLVPTGSQQITQPVTGTTVRLTIDRDVQWIAQRAIAERVEYAKADNGTVVVIDTTNGNIVAMATAPTFDPNHLSQAKAENLGNRITSDVYEPGSTAKVMTMAAVIEEGTATPTSKFTIPPVLRWPTETFHDHSPHGTLKLTLTGILAQSSNIGTIKAAKQMGAKKQYEYVRKFGVASSTGLGFPGESSGLLPAFENWSITTFPTVAFGQGLSVTALQAAQVFATIANDGVRISPRIVSGTVGEDGRFTAAPAGEKTRVVSTSTAQQVRLMMESVVSDEGTAAIAKIPGYRVAGKTGTANKFDDDCKCYSGYVASFIGLAPADKPRFVVAVSLTNPRNGHYGGVLGSPVFKEVMTYALQKYRVPPSTTKAKLYPTTWK